MMSFPHLVWSHKLFNRQCESCTTWDLYTCTRNIFQLNAVLLIDQRSFIPPNVFCTNQFQSPRASTTTTTLSSAVLVKGQDLLQVRVFIQQRCYSTGNWAQCFHLCCSRWVLFSCLLGLPLKRNSVLAILQKKLQAAGAE